MRKKALIVLIIMAVIADVIVYLKLRKRGI